MLRAEWLDCWQSMYEEQAAFAKLVGVGGSAKASEELLWTSGNVTSLELYSLRRRLVQMVDRWNEMMVALYTMVVREGFGGKWVPFDTLDRLIEAGFGQTLDVNGSVGPKRRLSRGGSFVGKNSGRAVLCCCWLWKCGASEPGALPRKAFWATRVAQQAIWSWKAGSDLF